MTSLMFFLSIAWNATTAWWASWVIASLWVHIFQGKSLDIFWLLWLRWLRQLGLLRVSRSCCLLFTQWWLFTTITSFLDLLEQPITRNELHGVTFAKLDLHMAV